MEVDGCLGAELRWVKARGECGSRAMSLMLRFGCAMTGFKPWVAWCDEKVRI